MRIGIQQPETNKIIYPISGYQTWETSAYAVSTPGSSMHAWPRMRMEDAPTSQKKVDIGEAKNKRGMRKGIDRLD